MLFCGSDNIPCYNGGICGTNSTFANSIYDLNSIYDFPIINEFLIDAVESCQCSQENGIEKYHGESCEMPGRDACAGSPCQNGGTCTTIIQGEIQARFIKYIIYIIYRSFMKVQSC